MSSFCTLELNDSAIRLNRDTRMLSTQPGVALIDHRRLLFGDAAVSEARIRPKQTYDRFWYALNQDAIDTPNPEVRSHADLAYLQLKGIVTAASPSRELVTVVHGGYSPEQLGIVLGILEAHDYHVPAMVDVAVAAAAATLAPGRYRHLNLSRHATIVTEIEVDDTVRRGATRIIAELGQRSLMETAVEVAAAAFIGQSRLDPLHQGESEQLLYNALPEWLLNLANQATHRAEIIFHGHRYEAVLSRRAFAKAFEPLFRRAASDSLIPGTTLIDLRWAHYPGLAEAVGEFRVLPDDAVASGCAIHRDRLLAGGDAVTLVTELPATGSASITPLTVPGSGDEASIVRAARHSATERPGSASDTMPTHLRHGNVAFALDGSPLYLDAAGRPSHGRPATVAAIIAVDQGWPRATENALGLTREGQALAPGTPLALGDRLTVPGVDDEYHLIAVANEGR